MPQLTAFPYLPAGKPRAAIDALTALCADVPEEGESFKAFRAHLRDHNLWDKLRVDDTLRFFRMSRGDVIVPSELMRALATADAAGAREILIERLWEANPLLCKTVVELLSERVHTRDELVSYFDSFAYHGEKIHRSQVEAWLHMARGLEIVKVIGIAYALDNRGKGLEKRALALDVEEFLEEDEPEVLPEPILSAPEAAEEKEEAAAESTGEQAVPVVRSETPSMGHSAATRIFGVRDVADPIGKERPVPVARFVGSRIFPDDVLAETATRIKSWWDGQEPAADSQAGIEDFGVDAEQWMEGADQVVYRLAVAAALVFRLGGERSRIVSAFSALDSAGVLADLYYGTAPDTLPDQVDAKALMLASLVARRCAESPELAVELERQKSAADAFACLDAALGRGLFKIELFWMMRCLAEIGALRFEDIGSYTALPHRLVRDTLFRLGFIESPYAHDLSALVPAAAAAQKASAGAEAADEAIANFALAAGCSYGCERARRCDFACRERAE